MDRINKQQAFHSKKQILVKSNSASMKPLALKRYQFQSKQSFVQDFKVKSIIIINLYVYVKENLSNFIFRHQIIIMIESARNSLAGEELMAAQTIRKYSAQDR